MGKDEKIPQAEGQGIYMSGEPGILSVSHVQSL